jgi:hypothetical protein
MQELNEELDKISNFKLFIFSIIENEFSRIEEARILIRIHLLQHKIKYFKISFSLFLKHKNAHI